jgi:hypothetical protein
MPNLILTISIYWNWIIILLSLQEIFEAFVGTFNYSNAPAPIKYKKMSVSNPGHALWDEPRAICTWWFWQALPCGWGHCQPSPLSLKNKFINVRPSIFCRTNGVVDFISKCSWYISIRKKQNNKSSVPEFNNGATFVPDSVTRLCRLKMAN